MAMAAPHCCVQGLAGEPLPCSLFYIALELTFKEQSRSQVAGQD